MEKTEQLLPGIIKLLMDVGEIKKELERLRNEVAMLKARQLSSTEKSTYIEHDKVTVGTEPTLILEIKEDRIDAVVKNLGDGKLYVGGTPRVSVGEGFELEMGAALKLEDYRGELWGVSDTGCDVRIIELIK